MIVRTKNIFLFLSVSALLCSGCYTQLMSPKEFVQTQRVQSKQIHLSNSFALNYNQSCVTCHSVAELDERADDMEYYGVRSVHDGFLLSRRQWVDDAVAQTPIFISPSNPYWPNPYSPGNSWWAPATVTSASPFSQPNSSGNRPRTDGATRDGSNERERPQSNSSTVYTAPQTPVGGTSTPPPAPASTTVVTQPPPSAPAQTTTGVRSRDSSSNSSSPDRTRNDGSSRDENGDRPR